MPGAPCRRSAATPIRIRPPSLIAIIIRLSPPIARHSVLIQRVVAYMTLSSHISPGRFRFHHHLLVAINHVSHEHRAIVAVANDCELDIERGVRGLRDDGHGHGEDEDQDMDGDSSHRGAARPFRREEGRSKGCMLREANGYWNGEVRFG
uniref:Uncharacterized protein n=1 Tax=Daucus carota subsp. sativus TaxID=79200 RepID=A0A164SPV2_DAUCS